MAPPVGRYMVKLNAIVFSMMLEDLLAGPCTAQDLAQHTGANILTIQRTLRQMYRRKTIHISGWEQDAQGRWVIRVFALGPGADKKRPAPRNRKSRDEAYKRTLSARGLTDAWRYTGVVSSGATL